jgi:hypothetical protein
MKISPVSRRLLLVLSLFVGALAARAEDTTAVAQTPEIDHMVYLSFLPEPDELMADAKANGLTILRLDQTADRVVVTYKYPDGHTATLGYAHLSTARSSDRVARRALPPSSAVYTQGETVVTRSPEIIYVDRTPSTRVVYRDPWSDFWGPLTIGLGLGYVSGHHNHHYYPRYHHSGYHGGYHGGHHGGHRSGHRRH